MSLIPTMMKEEMVLATKGERERSGFGNEGEQERNVAIYIWVLWEAVWWRPLGHIW